jgi:hypothetical protein
VFLNVSVEACGQRCLNSAGCKSFDYGTCFHLLLSSRFVAFAPSHWKGGLRVPNSAKQHKSQPSTPPHPPSHRMAQLNSRARGVHRRTDYWVRQLTNERTTLLHRPHSVRYPPLSSLESFLLTNHRCAHANIHPHLHRSCQLLSRCLLTVATCNSVALLPGTAPRGLGGSMHLRSERSAQRPAQLHWTGVTRVHATW